MIQKYEFKTTTRVNEGLIFTDFKDLAYDYINEKLLGNKHVELIVNPKTTVEKLKNVVYKLDNYFKYNSRYSNNCYNIFKETALNSFDDRKIVYLFHNYKLIGFQYICLAEEDKSIGHIVDSHVDIKYKSMENSLKKMLSKRSEQWFMENEVENIIVNVNCYDKDDIANYLKLGYIEEEITENNNLSMIKKIDKSLGQKKLIKE